MTCTILLLSLSSSRCLSLSICFSFYPISKLKYEDQFVKNLYITIRRNILMAVFQYISNNNTQTLDNKQFWRFTLSDPFIAILWRHKNSVTYSSSNYSYTFISALYHLATGFRILRYLLFQFMYFFNFYRLWILVLLYRMLIDNSSGW